MAKAKQSKAENVTVGCKLPTGVILELGNKSVQINGANSAHVIGGHGITRNVDAEFFNAWMAAHADRDMVKNGFIFAHNKTADTEEQAVEYEENNTGLEAITPDATENGVQTAEE